MSGGEGVSGSPRLEAAEAAEAAAAAAAAAADGAGVPSAMEGKRRVDFCAPVPPSKRVWATLGGGANLWAAAAAAEGGEAGEAGGRAGASEARGETTGDDDGDDDERRLSCRGREHR